MTAVVVSCRGRDLLDPAEFAQVAARVVVEHPQVAGMAERIVDQALAFVATAGAQSGRGLAPSPLVDLGWHQLILDTRLYAELCERIGAGFVHHVPDTLAPGGGVGGRVAGRVARTIAAITAAGYVVDAELWAADGKCGPCHEDGNCSNSGGDGNENTDDRTKGPR